MKQFSRSLILVFAFGAAAIVFGQSSETAKSRNATMQNAPGAILTVTAPTQFVTGASVVTLALQVTDTTGQGVLGYRGEITYDPTVLQTIGANSGCDVTGTISSSLTPFCSDVVINANTRKITFFPFGSTPLTGAGNLIKFNFQVIGGAGTFSPLLFTDFFFNEGGPADPGDLTMNGLITVSSPTAAAGVIGGRVSTSAGRPVSNVQVSLTDNAGLTRLVVSNPFGFFEFDDVLTGSTYILSGSAKNFTFQPRVVTLIDDLVSVDLVADQ